MHTKFESVEPMVTKLRSGQAMLYKNQRGIIQNRNMVKLRLLCTALRVIARNMQTKFGVIWTYAGCQLNLYQKSRKKVGTFFMKK